MNETDWVGNHFASKSFTPGEQPPAVAIVCVGASFRAVEYELGRPLDV